MTLRPQSVREQICGLQLKRMRTPPPSKKLTLIDSLPRRVITLHLALYCKFNTQMYAFLAAVVAQCLDWFLCVRRCCLAFLGFAVFAGN